MIVLLAARLPGTRLDKTAWISSLDWSGNGKFKFGILLFKIGILLFSRLGTAASSAAPKRRTPNVPDPFTCTVCLRSVMKEATSLQCSLENHTWSSSFVKAGGRPCRRPYHNHGRWYQCLLHAADQIKRHRRMFQQLGKSISSRAETRITAQSIFF